MTTDRLELGPVPCDEECQQVGTSGYDPQAARAECARYRDMLTRLFPVPENTYGRFAVKAFPHDFGTYHEVCAVFDGDDEASVEWAFNVENNLPATWDDEIATDESRAYGPSGAPKGWDHV